MSSPAYNEAQGHLNFLCGMPSGNATASSRAVVREVMLICGGWVMACGHLYDVRSKHLGGGVYRLTLVKQVQ